MKKRILIAYFLNNISEESVVNILYNKLCEINKFEVMMVNIADYTNLFDKNSKYFEYFFKFTSKVLSKRNFNLYIHLFDNEKLRNIFKDFNPDTIISTHFCINYIVGNYKSDGLINSKIISIFPDYESDIIYTVNHDEVDFYIVNNDKIKRDFIKDGVRSEKIYISSLPTQKRESIPKDTLLKRYNLSGDKPIYLFFGDNSETIDYFKELAKKNYNIEIIFICGKSKIIKEKCDEFVRDNKIKNSLILSFIKDIYNLMNISDVVISKPNAYTINEIIGNKKPSILIQASNVLEKKNARFMVKKNYSVSVSSPYSLSKKVNLFLSYPFIVKSMANKLAKLDRSNNEVFLDILLNIIKK